MIEELKLLITTEEISERIKTLAKEIERDFSGEELVFIGTLKGAFIFLADLVRHIRSKEVLIDFVRVKSYGFSDTSSGEVIITKDIEIPIEGKNVILVEDIIDTGITLDFLKRHLSLHSPKTIKICALIDKRERRKVDIKPDYVGFVIDSGFLVGFGLDFAERYRHLPQIYEVIKRE